MPIDRQYLSTAEQFLTAENDSSGEKNIVTVWRSMTRPYILSHPHTHIHIDYLCERVWWAAKIYIKYAIPIQWCVLIEI